jgi:hypothetical protein
MYESYYRARYFPFHVQLEDAKILEMHNLAEDSTPPTCLGSTRWRGNSSSNR